MKLLCIDDRVRHQPDKGAKIPDIDEGEIYHPLTHAVCMGCEIKIVSLYELTLLREPQALRCIDCGHITELEKEHSLERFFYLDRFRWVEDDYIHQKKAEDVVLV